MTPQNTSRNASEDEPIGTAMNDTTHETKPYPSTGSTNDPMTGLLADPTTPAAHTQDATTTESFAWTGAETTPHAPPLDSPGAGTWANSSPSAPAYTAPKEPQGQRPARAGTIVWGCILFLVAALAAVPAILGDAVLSPTAFLWIVVGFGTLLVVGGIIGAIVSAATRRSRAERANTH